MFITYQRRSHSRGYFSADRFSGRVDKSGRHELALNPDYFIGRSDEEITSTLDLSWPTMRKKSGPGYAHVAFLASVPLSERAEWTARMIVRKLMVGLLFDRVAARNVVLREE